MEIQRNSIIYYKNSLMRITEVEFFKPGKGQVTYRTTLKDLLKDTVMSVSFRAKDKIKYAPEVREQSATFLYRERDQLVFSQAQVHELIYVPIERLAPLALSLVTHALGEVSCKLLLEKQEVLRVMLPITVNLTVVAVTQHARPSDTAHPSMYPIKVTGDIELKAPHFIKRGEVIAIDTATISYVRREGS